MHWETPQTETMTQRMAKRSTESLLYIIQDCAEAIRANPESANTNRYLLEIGTAVEQLQQRQIRGTLCH